MKQQLILMVSLLLMVMSVQAENNYLERDAAQQMIQRLVADGYERQQIEMLVKAIKPQQRVLELMSKPAEGKPWYDYRPIFVTDKRANLGVEFWQEYKDILSKAEAQFGVPAEIITAIIGVETYYGRNTGGVRVLDSLATLGFDYPKRAKFFASELEHYLRMTLDEGLDTQALKGSYAGAMGLGQFIPSSYRAYAVDFDGDGKRDLWNPVDAIGSVANYFKRHGWKTGEGVVYRATVSGRAYKNLKTGYKPKFSVSELKQAGIAFPKALDKEDQLSFMKFEQKKANDYWVGLKNFYVITRYNHSQMYAMAVYQLSQEIADRKRK